MAAVVVPASLFENLPGGCRGMEPFENVKGKWFLRIPTYVSSF
jgi:hypothetical protein